MIERYKDMVDRLQAKEAMDRWLFLGFALGGAAVIWVSKALEVQAILVALFAAVLMVGYAVLVSRGEKLKQRADQLGDNCYYLGLLYTLASLSFAIFTFDPANTATTIVQGFGIALISTILGLALRVYFIQGQPDLAATEENARLALTETAARVRAELDGVLQSFATFSTQTQQHLIELRDQVRIDMEQTSRGAREAINATSEEARELVSSQAAETVAEVRKVATSVGRLVKSLEGHAETMGVIAGRSTSQLDQLGMIEKAGSAAASALTQVTGAAEMVHRYQSSLDTSAARLLDASDGMATGVTALQKAAGDFDGLVQARLASLGDAPTRATERIDEGLTSALARWQAALDAQARDVTAAQAAIAAARAEEIEALRRHNEAMAGELRTSRENVTQVHSALVSMTTELTNQVAAQP